MIPLFLFRPLRLCLSSEHVRSARIVLLKVTHFPYLAGIRIYEGLSAICSRWHPTSSLQKRTLAARYRRTRAQSLRPFALHSRLETPTPETPLNAGRRPNCSATIQEPIGAVGEGNSNKEQRIKELGSLIKQLMTTIADNGETGRQSRSDIQAIRDLSMQLQTLIEGLETRPEQPVDREQ